MLLTLATLAMIPQVRAQAPAAGRDDSAGQDSVRAEEPKAHPLTLTVVDRRTGRPLVNAKVEATVRGVVRKGTTDQAGRFVFDRPEAEPRSISIKVSQDGFVPTNVSWNVRGGVPITPPATYTLRMEPGTTIGGRVRSPEGRPIAGATVYVLVARPPATRPEPEPVVDIWDHPNLTDADGRWHCDLVPTELAEVWIRLEHPGYVSDTSYNSTPRPSMAQLRDGTGVMVMKKGLSVAGVVRDTEGRPLSGAKVAQGADRWGSESRDHDRSRRPLPIRAGRPRQPRADDPGQGPRTDSKEIEVAPGLPDVEFRLGPPHSLRGRVMNPDGKPLAGAMVVADASRRASVAIDSYSN